MMANNNGVSHFELGLGYTHGRAHRVPSWFPHTYTHTGGRRGLPCHHCQVAPSAKRDRHLVSSLSSTWGDWNLIVQVDTGRTHLRPDGLLGNTAAAHAVSPKGRCCPAPFHGGAGPRWNRRKNTRLLELIRHRDSQNRRPLPAVSGSSRGQRGYHRPFLERGWSPATAGGGGGEGGGPWQFVAPVHTCRAPPRACSVGNTILAIRE